MHELIKLTEWGTLPLAYSSYHHRGELAQRGRVLVSQDYYLVFEPRPCTVNQVLVVKEAMMEGKRVPLPPSGIEYLYTASVYYRKSRNPHGPSHRPIFAFCLEYSEISCEMLPQTEAEIKAGKPKVPTHVFVAYFHGKGRNNAGLVRNDFTDDSAFDLLTASACTVLGLTRDDFHHLGTLSHGHDSPELA
jgi:hypothetical protein